MAQLELRRQTRILMESEAKLLSVFHNCPVAFAIIRWDNKKFVDVNSAFTQLIGYSTAEVLGHRDSAQRGASLVQQVLSFAKGVEGRHVTVNPITVISDLVKVTKETFPKSVTVQFNSGPDLWSISADPTQMHQVFLNLCINARDAMPHGGTLTITLENIVLDDTYAAMNIDARPGAYVVVTVADTGTGIPPEVRERIFEPFFTTKEVGKGTGLGLSTAMAILKSHFGFINVYSEPGGGTKFKVYLPANTTVAAADEVAVEQTKLPRGRGELILVVDDEEAVRDIVQAALERFGYRVMLATNGAEAVALYAQHRAAISVVLMDMAMPVMDGPSTIIALRSVNPQVRVIASSGLASDGRVAIALGAGVRHFLPKPYTAEAILKMLKEVLAESGESTAP
jgi:CheY-like chemotaxis protein